jgi:hypothetical protein
MACSTLFVGVFALGAASALGGTCTAGADVQCPGSGNICAGDQCCPGYAGSGGGTFPCPSASIGFLGCVNNTKITNCVPGSLRGSLAQNKLQMQDTCTAYSQCGGQNWHGCTECPGQQVCQFKGTDRWTKVCVGQPAELSSEGPARTCTAYSQCGGQNWHGCTECPGQQVCQLTGTDPWTKVCVGQPTELSNESPARTCTAYSQCGGQNWHGCTECPGQQVCQLKGTDPWTKVCVGQPAELSNEGPGQTCTAYSQCGGQNWHGCTECPGQQVCQLKGTDRWTEVCVGQLAELSSAAEVVNTTTAGFTTGGLAETQDLPCGSDNSDDCVTEFHHGLGPFCFRCSHEGGSNPLRNRCHLCCTEC